VTPLLGQWKWDFFHPHNDRLTGGETEVHGRGSPDCSLSGELTEWRNPRIQGFWGGGGGGGGRQEKTLSLHRAAS
jgi:hypothetical protein